MNIMKKPGVRMRNLGRRTKEWAKRNGRYELARHISDSTAVVTFFSPICGTIEKVIAKMSDDVSINSRLISAGLTYGGLGNLSKARDWSKEKFGISKETGMAAKFLHDGALAAAFVFVIRPTIYLASGETDLKKIAIGTIAITGLSALLGGPAGHVIDEFRDLTGVEKSEDVPELVTRQRYFVKRRRAAYLVAASLALTSLIYRATPDYEPNSDSSPTIARQNISGVSK